jgi:hypothetical protein
LTVFRRRNGPKVYLRVVRYLGQFMGLRSRRLRGILDQRAASVVALLLLVAAVGGAVTYTTYVAPGSHVETRAGPTATYSGGFSHQATVTETNPVFPVGETLSDRSVYLTRVSPTLNGTFRYSYTASDGGALTVDGTLSLVVRAVDESGDGTSEYWRTTRELDGVEGRTLGPDESLTLSFAANVTAIQSEIERIRRDLGTTAGTPRVTVVADVDATGPVNDRSTTRDDRYELSVEPGQGTYRVTGGDGTIDRTNRTERVRVRNSYGPLRRIGGPVVLAVGLLGLVGFGAARRRGVLAPDDTEREILAHETARREYDEWITTGRVHRLQGDERLVDVDSLTGLVDVAIDSDSRVIQAESKPQYVVITDGVVYRYDAPSAASEADAEADPLGDTE